MTDYSTNCLFFDGSVSLPAGATGTLTFTGGDPVSFAGGTPNGSGGYYGDPIYTPISIIGYTQGNGGSRGVCNGIAIPGGLSIPSGTGGTIEFDDGTVVSFAASGGAQTSPPYVGVGDPVYDPISLT